ncbi:squalene/phytoene synthase family protein [Aquabacterium sp.]|uniref:squalene/phytoene synthase family protein n=1 Tax=Aquabacterium sp. TaxID=1872578 RepID=UPI0035B44989
MTPERHRLQPGSSVYYAIRFAPRHHRPALTTLHEIVQAIRSTPREITDPGVAQAKLTWWRNELAQSSKGNPQHPATRRLFALLGMSGARCWPALQACVATTESGAQQSRYLDETALLRQIEASANGLAQALAAVLHPDAAETNFSAEVAIGLVQALRNLGRDARQGDLFIPINDLQQFDVKAHEIMQFKAGLQEEPRYLALMRHQAERAHRHLALARACLREQPRPLRRFHAALLAHNSELLGAIESHHFAVLNQHIALTPLRKLWLAWSAR